MKKLLILIFCFSCFQVETFSQGEENSNWNCSYSLKNTSRFISSKESLSPEQFTEIDKLLESCSDSNPNYNFIKAKVIYLKNENMAYAYNLFKDSAESGHVESMYMVGLMLKNGIGIKQDFNNAYKWFSKSAALGNEKSKYSLGYFYLKGLGDLNSDYDLATTYFKESNYSMAKHWLAICYLYGYGVEINKESALDLFENNKIYNSKFFLNQLELNLSLDSIIPNEDYNSNIFQFEKAEGDIIGTYTGIYTELDWAGQKIQRLLPIRIELGKEKNNLNYEINLDGKIGKGTFDLMNNNVKLNNFSLSLSGLHIDHPSNQNLKYLIDQLSLFDYDGEILKSKFNVIGSFSGQIKNWSEPLPPHVVYLNYTPLSKLEKIHYEDLIISPNPFQEQFKISFEIQENAFVIVNIYNTAGKTVRTGIINEKLDKGKYTYVIDLSNQITGNYILEIQADKTRLSKIIIKK